MQPWVMSSCPPAINSMTLQCLQQRHTHGLRTVLIEVLWAAEVLLSKVLSAKDGGRLSGSGRGGCEGNGKDFSSHVQLSLESRHGQPSREGPLLM